MPNNYTPMECPTCGGEGATYEQVRVGQFATPFVCSACDGSGEAQDHRPTTEQDLGDEIARVRHGQPVTASDLANRLIPWLAARDAEVRKDEREKVAAEIEAVADSEPQIIGFHCTFPGPRESGLRAAARIARGATS
ncbi:hypothetical protein GCM10010401_07060 [Rarobacter faecitabidus]|uniref:Uncharacterized protein n=1 Tax=Rarobacter faecitabidus TaxID=13243 RepID=A0A542ZTE9_RARFA|nr:hypothetical protein [Rarobacter faecitabidus]TQL63546.1 hypothetical protein FB461_0005 [Rarobacter faecitabidus]